MVIFPELTNEEKDTMAKISVCNYALHSYIRFEKLVKELNLNTDAAWNLYISHLEKFKKEKDNLCLK